MAKKKIEETGYDILSALDPDSNQQRSVQNIMSSDPMDVLRTDLLSFFRTMIAEISRRVTLKEELEETFRQDIQTGEMTFEERMRLHKALSTDFNISLENFLGLFKPTPGAPSLLAQNLSKPEDRDDIYDKVFKDLSSEEMRKLDKLMKALQIMSKEEEEKD